MRARIAVLFLWASFLWTGNARPAEKPPQQVRESSQAAVDAEHQPQVAPSQVEISQETIAAFDAARQQGASTLEALYAAMKEDDRGKRWEGITYALSKDNALDPDWIVQTPNVWGKKAKDVKPGAGSFVADRVTKLVASAQKFVDIMTLTPFPAGRFESAVVDGLKQLAESRRAVTVRVLAGWYPGGTGGRLKQAEYLKQIIKKLKDGYPGSKLQIYVATQRADLFSWNHTKIVAVDGERALTGGQNLWDADYLRLYPAHDLSLSVNGSSAFAMHAFADQVWKSVCAYNDDPWKSAFWKAGMEEVTTGCLAQSGLTKPTGPGTLPILGAGRLGRLVSLLEHPNAADVAFWLSLHESKKTIRISQQDLGLPVLGIWTYWGPGMTAIAQALVRKEQVYIVLTNDGAKAGSPGIAYWTGIPLTGTADRIKSYVAKIKDAPKDKALIDLLCSNLHLAPLRFGPSDQWPNKAQFANHAKFWMVDDQLFYVGSENLYPADLQEYGVILNDAKAAAQIKKGYWDKLWSYSKRAAISGSEVTKCYFRK